MIRADLTLVPDPLADARRGHLRRRRGGARGRADLGENPRNASLSAAGGGSRPGRGRAEGQGRRSLFFAGAGLALLDAILRRDPPAAGALRARLALQSAAASAKILRLNADQGALRDLRFAVGDAGPAARLLQLWRDLAGRPPSLDAGRLAAAAARARPGRGPERASHPA